MFWDCLRFFAQCVLSILNFTIPGTDITFLALAVGLAFLPVCINVFARIFGGTIGVDNALRTARKIEQSNREGDDE